MPIIPTAAAPRARRGVVEEHDILGGDPERLGREHVGLRIRFGDADLGGIDERGEPGELRPGGEPLAAEDHVGVVGQDPDG